MCVRWSSTVRTPTDSSREMAVFDHPFAASRATRSWAGLSRDRFESGGAVSRAATSAVSGKVRSRPTASSSRRRACCGSPVSDGPEARAATARAYRRRGGMSASRRSAVRMWTSAARPERASPDHRCTAPTVPGAPQDRAAARLSATRRPAVSGAAQATSATARCEPQGRTAGFTQPSARAIRPHSRR